MKKKNKRQPDFLLETMLEAGSTTGLPITLFVKGIVITGTITKLSSFYRASVVSLFGSDEVPGLEQLAVELGAEEAEYAGIKETPYEEQTKAQRKALAARHSFINLTDAYFQTGDGKMAPSNTGLNLRVRVDSVDAWVLGEMSVEHRL